MRSNMKDLSMAIIVLSLMSWTGCGSGVDKISSTIEQRAITSETTPKAEPQQQDDAKTVRKQSEEALLLLGQ
jgi:hypothetical protein